jgi:hypothetical protein
MIFGTEYKHQEYNKKKVATKKKKKKPPFGIKQRKMAP